MTVDVDRLSVQIGGAEILRDISANFHSGCWTGVMGVNGSGKSTLLRAICGLLPVSGGAISISGFDCTGDPAFRAEHLSIAPDSRLLPTVLTGLQILTIAAGGVRALRDLVDGPLSGLWRTLDMVRYLNQPVRVYSEGMKQRVCIMAAFATGQELIFLDEPFNWIDAVGAYDLKAEFRALVAKGFGLVTTLQEPVTFQTCCDSGYVLSQGELALSLSAAELRSFGGNSEKFEAYMVDLLRRN